MEFWKDVEGYQGVYKVSNLGRVKSLKYNKERFLKQEKSKGYKRVSLSKNNEVQRYLVHRLVANYFIINAHDKKCVNHINGDKLNNYANNLEWCTHSENERHSYDVLGKINQNRKLTKQAIKDIKENCIKGVNHLKKGNVSEFMIKYNVDRTTILNVYNKKYYV